MLLWIRSGFYARMKFQCGITRDHVIIGAMDYAWINVKKGRESEKKMHQITRGHTSVTHIRSMHFHQSVPNINMLIQPITIITREEKKNGANKI